LTTWNLHISKLPDFCHPVEWAIQLPNLIHNWNLQIFKLPDFCRPVEWAIQLPEPIYHLKLPNFPNFPIFVIRLSGWSNYPTQFITWNLQIFLITRFLSPGCVGNPITRTNVPPEISKFPKLPNFCHPVEWAIQLPDPIYHLKSPNFPNYPISVTRLSGQSNYPTWFNNWNLPIFVTWLSGQSNYPTQFTTWNLQIAAITWFCHPVEWAIQSPYPLLHTFSGSNIISLPDLPTYHLKSPPTNYWI